MPINTQTQANRLTRISQKVRTDGWPEAPQIAQSMVDKFPELGDFNQAMREAWEQMRNATEPDAGSSTT